MKSLFMKMKTVSLFMIVAIILFSGVCYSTSNPKIHISHYEYGEIILNEKMYNNDIAIWPDGEVKAGPEDMHFFSKNDFKELFNSDLKKLVIGTGDEGKVELDFGRKLKKELKNRDIELITMDTHNLVKFLNETTVRDFLVFVHLNC